MMNGVGVFDESVGELVGAEIVLREKAAGDFKHVLRMMRESIGEDSNHKTMVSANQTLRALLMLALVSTTDALSLPSPMSFLLREQFPNHGFSLAVISFLVILFVCVSAVAMMPHVNEPEPEAEVSVEREARASTRQFNKPAVYGFLCVCVKQTLRLIDEAEYESNDAEVSSLNAMHELLMDMYSRFEDDGISPEGVRSMVELHNSLRSHEPEFNAFSCISVEPESGFTNDADEPEVESFLPPDPPADFVLTEPAAAFEPHSPEHMALWMIQRLTERLGRAMESGRAASVLKYVEQREVMVRICRFCSEHPEQRNGVWMMMQDLTDLSSSDDES